MYTACNCINNYCEHAHHHKSLLFIDQTTECYKYDPPGLIAATAVLSVTTTTLLLTCLVIVLANNYLQAT